MAANLAPPSIPVDAISQLLDRHRGLREGLQFFTREKLWINDIHQQLCRIPAPTFLERQRAEWMAAQFRALGCDAHIDRAGNVVATLVPATRGPYIAVTAHLDTVIAPRHKDDIVVDPDGKLRGPGVSDNGAGLTALLALSKALKSSPALDDSEIVQAAVLFVANVGEEGEGNLSGMRFLCKQSPLSRDIAAFLVLDGATTEHITIQALGSRRFDVTFNGPGGHSWSDFGIGNPVHALSRAVALFTETRLTDAPPGSPRSSISVGIIEGGTSINSIAAVARAKVDIRSESNQKMEDLVAALHVAVEHALDIENQRSLELQRSGAGKLAARVKEIGSRPAARLKENSPVLGYIRAVDAHLGIRSHLDCASTDANIPLSLGIPALSIGAGGQGGGAHTLQEWFNPEGRDLGLKRILLILALLLQNQAPSL